MRSSYSSIFLLCAALLLLCPAAWAQETFTGNRGFAPTLKMLTDTPAPKADLSIQVPGNVELNGCVRFTKAGGDACLCFDATTAQIWSETDCDGAFDSGSDFFIGSGGPGGGGASKIITDAVSEIDGEIVGDGVNRFIRWCDSTNCYDKCMLDDQPCPPDIIVPTGQPLRFFDDASLAISFDFGAVLPHDKYKFEPGYEPFVSTEVMLRPAGNCSVAEASIVTNDPLAEWITCVDTTGDSVAFSYRVTNKIAADATAKITLLAVNQNTAAAGTYSLACAARSTRPNLDLYAAHDTTGQQTVSFVFTNTNTECTAAATPFSCCTGAGTGTCISHPEEASATFAINGTVAAGAHIKGQCNVTAVPAQIANIRLHGMAVIELGADSLSD